MHGGLRKSCSLGIKSVAKICRGKHKLAKNFFIRFSHRKIAKKLYDYGHIKCEAGSVKKIIVFVEELYEDLELWYPKIRLEEAGHKVMVAGPVAGQVYKGKHGYPCKADISFKEVVASELSGLVIPGGFAPDRLRRSAEVLDIVRKVHEKGEPVAMICHAGWVAISAKILKGKKATSLMAIKDDMENAGVTWLDEPVVVDQNLISSRTPADLPFFAKALLEQLK